MKRPSLVIRAVLVSLILMENPKMSSALLWIVRQNCNAGAVFVPVPSTVNNYCLQCLCIRSGISYCKPLIVQISVTCTTAAIALVTAAPAVTTQPPVTVPTIPPTAATTAIGINPRASVAPAIMVMSGSNMAAVTTAPAVIPAPGSAATTAAPAPLPAAG